MPEDTLFDDPGVTSDDELLIAAYARQARTLDDLPYTEAFESIYRAVVGEGHPDEPKAGLSRSALFHRLHNLRKSGRLPRLGRAASSPPKVDPDHEAVLVGLVEQAVGRLSLRDQLPFTAEFDALVAGFNEQAGLNLSPHDIWRIVAKLAK